MTSTRSETIAIAQVMKEFSGMDKARYDSLGRAGSALQCAAYGGISYAALLSKADYEELSAFVEYLGEEFRLIGILGRDDKPDRQFSRDGYGSYRDAEKF